MRAVLLPGCLVLLLLPGCLTTYYDSATWTDQGLADTLRQMKPAGWSLREVNCATPCVVATTGDIEVVAPEIGSEQEVSSGPDRYAPPPGEAAPCTLRHEGSSIWTDNQLRQAIDALYAQLGRRPPENVTFGHMHGD